MITIAEIKEKAERTKEKIRLEKNIQGMSSSARHEVLSILEKGNYLIPKKLNSPVKDLPVVFSNNRIIIYEHGHLKFFVNLVLMKQIPCKPTDKFNYDGKTVFITHAPKIKWKKMLWEVGLSKGNWRHPNMVKEEDIFFKREFYCKDQDGNVLGSITYWETHKGFKMWYAQPKKVDEKILEEIVCSMVPLIKARHNI